MCNSCGWIPRDVRLSSLSFLKKWSLRTPKCVSDHDKRRFHGQFSLLESKRVCASMFASCASPRHRGAFFPSHTAHVFSTNHSNFSGSVLIKSAPLFFKAPRSTVFGKFDCRHGVSMQRCETRNTNSTSTQDEDECCSSRRREVRHFHKHVNQGDGPAGCRLQRSMSDNKRTSWRTISLSSECEMSDQPNTPQDHRDTGESRLRNQQRLRFMRVHESTDPNSFFAPEPKELSLEREMGTDSLNSLLFGGCDDLKH